MANKKPQTSKNSGLPIQHNTKTLLGNYSIVRIIGKLSAIVNIEGNMSEQGADKAGLEISAGLKFFFKACGIGIAIGFFLWLSPDFIKALSDFILTLKNN